MAFPFTVQLPPLGAHESDVLDFKTEVKPLAGKRSADRFELAKDVAAFANAAGGTLLVGACGGSTLTAFKEMTAEECDWLAREYEEAVRDRCAPPVSIRTQPISQGFGFVLAVHVPPFPSPVAVRVQGDKADGWGRDGWVFFARAASQNKDFRPELLPMLTPETRRIAVLLRSIAAGELAHVVTRTKNDGGIVELPNCAVVSVDEMTNSVVLKLEGGRTKSVPLDRVRTVFRGLSVWHLEIDHYFQIQ